MQRPWIVIPSLDGRHWLEECLATLTTTLPGHVEIIVVDNGSMDGTVSYLRENYPRIHCLPLECNLGFVQATNLGVHFARRSGADSYLLVNNDTRFRPGWFESLQGRLVAILRQASSACSRSISRDVSVLEHKPRSRDGSRRVPQLLTLLQRSFSLIGSRVPVFWYTMPLSIASEFSIPSSHRLTLRKSIFAAGQDRPAFSWEW